MPTSSNSAPPDRGLAHPGTVLPDSKTARRGTVLPHSKIARRRTVPGHARSADGLSSSRRTPGSQHSLTTLDEDPGVKPGTTCAGWQGRSRPDLGLTLRLLLQTVEDDPAKFFSGRGASRHSSYRDRVRGDAETAGGTAHSGEDGSSRVRTQEERPRPGSPHVRTPARGARLNWLAPSRATAARQTAHRLQSSRPPPSPSASGTVPFQFRDGSFRFACPGTVLRRAILERGRTVPDVRTGRARPARWLSSSRRTPGWGSTASKRSGRDPG